MKLNFAVLPFIFLKFWFVEAPLALLEFFKSVNDAFFVLFSLPLFLKTFFKPLKSEYRKRLVGFSRGMGMFIKSILILADVFMLIILLTLEAVVLFGFIAFPMATIWVLFLKF